MSTIFISYSHEDSSLVGPVVALLRASDALVFQDADSVRPGKRWREEVGTAISAASIVVVFWCHHARASTEVGNEIRAAITQKKDVLPLLIDETPLPGNLAEFQYIDFRAAFGKGHVLELAPVSSVTEAAHSRTVEKPWAAGLLAGLIAIAVAVLSWRMSSFAYMSSPAYRNPPDESVWLSPTSLWLFVFLIGLVLLIVLRLRWARKRRPTHDHEPRPVPKPAKRWKALWWIIACVIILVLSSVSLSRGDLDIIPLLQSILVLGITWIVLIILWWGLRRAFQLVVLWLGPRPMVRSSSDARLQPGMLARAIEEELLRRTGARDGGALP